MKEAIDSLESLRHYVEAENIRFFRLAVTDIDGVLRGKYVEKDKFFSVVEKGLSFCDVVLGWDSTDQLYPNAELSGWHTGYGDAHVELDLRSLRRLAEEPNTVLLLGSFSGQHAEACPRSLLARVIKRATAQGLFPRGAFEYEFFVFDETPDSVREKGYANLKPFTPGMFGYSMLRSSVHAELYHELLDLCQAMDMPIEGLHTETGPGVLEAALSHAPLLEGADRATLFKTFTKAFLQRRGLLGTFMAKWSNTAPGQSGHLHISLEDERGKNLFSQGPSELNPLARKFISGQAKLLPLVLPMVCSTINSYRRLVPGLWAPTHATWGLENRTCAVRGITGADAARSEYRIGPADGNPYLVAAAALATGLYGIEHDVDEPPIEGNGYENPGLACPLPTSLKEATAAFADSSVTRELFGDTFVKHFAMTRFWEDEAARKHVSDFDLKRYFEII